MSGRPEDPPTTTHRRANIQPEQIDLCTYGNCRYDSYKIAMSKLHVNVLWKPWFGKSPINRYMIPLYSNKWYMIIIPTYLPYLSALFPALPSPGNCPGILSTDVTQIQLLSECLD